MEDLALRRVSFVQRLIASDCDTEYVFHGRAGILAPYVATSSFYYDISLIASFISKCWMSPTHCSPESHRIKRAVTGFRGKIKPCYCLRMGKNQSKTWPYSEIYTQIQGQLFGISLSLYDWITNIFLN